jgi:hypothetical protein
MSSVLIPIARLVNEGRESEGDLPCPRSRNWWKMKSEPGIFCRFQTTVLSQCNWTPFAGQFFRNSVSTTIVSGQIAWHDKRLNDSCQGLPLRFMR